MTNSLGPVCRQNLLSHSGNSFAREHLMPCERLLQVSQLNMSCTDTRYCFQLCLSYVHNHFWSCDSSPLNMVPHLHIVPSPAFQFVTVTPYTSSALCCCSIVQQKNMDDLAAIQKESNPLLTVVIGTCNSVVKQYDCKTQCNVTVPTWWQLWQCTYICYVNFMQFLWTHEHHLQFLTSFSIDIVCQKSTVKFANDDWSCNCHNYEPITKHPNVIIWQRGLVDHNYEDLS